MSLYSRGYYNYLQDTGEALDTLKQAVSLVDQQLPGQYDSVIAVLHEFLQQFHSQEFLFDKLVDVLAHILSTAQPLVRVSHFRLNLDILRGF